MSVLGVNKTWSSDTSTSAWDGRTASEVYQVITDNKFEAETASFGNVTIPAVGTPHPDKPSMQVEDKAVDSAGFGLMNVTVNYSIPENGSFAPESDAEDPLSAPPVESWETGTVTEQFDRDINGDVVNNSAGVPLEQPITRTISTVFLNIKSNQPTPFNPSVALKFLNKVNSIPFRSVDAGHAKVVRYAPESAAIDDAATYFVLHIRVELREDSFQGRFLDRGRTMLVDGVSTKILVDDLPGALVAPELRDKGTPVSTTKLLDGDGALTADPNIIEFNNYKETNLEQMPGVK